MTHWWGGGTQKTKIITVLKNSVRLHWPKSHLPTSTLFSPLFFGTNSLEEDQFYIDVVVAEGAEEVTVCKEKSKKKAEGEN